jgi:hypothetical protein
MAKTQEQVFTDIHEIGELRRLKMNADYVLGEMIALDRFRSMHPKVSRADLEVMAAWIGKQAKGLSCAVMIQAWNATR